jgi:hypothetical protein
MINKTGPEYMLSSLNAMFEEDNFTLKTTEGRSELFLDGIFVETLTPELDTQEGFRIVVDKVLEVKENKKELK